MQQVLLIGLGGALGSIGRYGIALGSRQLVSTSLPIGTFGANIAGCFIIGLLAPIIVSTDIVPKAWQLPLTVGFLGGLTTFSSFSLETVRLFNTQDWRYAAANILANVFCGTGATILGMILARRWIAS